jgi:ATP/maltotriose-dependent transcriptional regulator MalT/DNA-binding SARP family transcriptional activator
MHTTAAARLPAKLSPPSVIQALQRERLFGWLDEQRRGNAAIWLHGAPGAGKTTLAASYLRARSVRHLWYRLDADDNDFGRFFAVLGEAVDAHAGIRARRPPFAIEHLAQPRAYARAWFRAAFAALPRPLAIVLDNVEQAAALSQLPELLAAAIEEVPEGVALLVTCRQAPPPVLAAARLAGQLVLLEPAQLDFTPDEIALYARELNLDAAVVAQASARVKGWAAGVRLLSHGATSALQRRCADGASLQLLFDYFAGVLHDSLDAQAQHLLLVAALLPWVPAPLAAQLAQTPDAAERLDELCERHLFVERVEQTDSAVYRLHPLLRELLLDRGRRTLPADERRSLLHTAAAAFAGERQLDAATDLLLDADDVDLAAQSILDSLEAKLDAGQLDQWMAWVQRLPADRVERDAGLQYGLARVAFLREDAAALGCYERACAAYAAAGDLRGQQLCAAGVLEWSYNSDSFIGHQRWVELLRRGDPAADAAPGGEQHALRLLNGRLLAAFFGGDFERHGAALTDAVLALLVPGAAENDKLSVAITLLGCLERHKRWDEAQLLAARMEAMLESPRLGPRLRILVRQQIAADLHRQCGNYTEVRRLATQALGEARTHGFAVLEYEAVATLLLAALYSGDGVEARRLLAQLDALDQPANVYHQRFGQQMHAWLALQGGHVAAAREHADALRAAIARSDMPAGFCATWLLVAVLVRHADGDEIGACDELALLAGAAEPGSRATLQANHLALVAWRALRDVDRDAALHALRECLALAAPRRYHQLVGPLRAMLARLADLALEAGIEPAFTRELIRRRRLEPPSLAGTNWPWPLRITTLGSFEIVVDGQPLRFDGKAPRKPLALLKALIALGARDVPEAALADALWPDDDADAASDALNVALHRLRKLLPHGAELVRLRDGCLGLDAGAVWLDCRAFEQLAAEADVALDAGAPALDLLRRALALYRGHFLAADADEPWSVSARERLRSKFNRVVGACARSLSAAGRDEEALACYKRGLETEDLDERLYQGVMRCAIALRRPAEGIAAYQRCRRVLAMLVGVAPSIDTESLLRQLLLL